MANICKNCKHHYVKGIYMHEYYTLWTDYCKKSETKELDLVTGQTFTNKVSCTFRRSSMKGDECPDFEQREIKPKAISKPWWKIW